MAFDLYSKTRTVDFGGIQAANSSTTSLTEEYVGDAYNGLLVISHSGSTDGLSNISVRTSVTSNFTASDGTAAELTQVSLDSTGADLTITSNEITSKVSNGTYVFNVRKLQPYVNIKLHEDTSGTDSFCVVLVATTLGEAPAAYSDATSGNY